MRFRRFVSVKKGRVNPRKSSDLLYGIEQDVDDNAVTNGRGIENTF
jgi:hypothetical protein